MKFCTHCGKEIMDAAVICPNCGCSTQANNTAVTGTPDAPNTGMAVLGFFIPLAGLIIYLVNKDTKPQLAHSAGKGALIGFFVSLAISIIYGAMVGSMIGSLL